MAESGNSSAPPGWYADASASLRWWDGRAWGPVAPTSTSSNVAAMFSHVGLCAFYFVLPLVLRLTVGERDAFVRQHATEALNGQITFGLLWLDSIRSGRLPPAVAVTSSSDRGNTGHRQARLISGAPCRPKRRETST